MNMLASLALTSLTLIGPGSPRSAAAAAAPTARGQTAKKPTKPVKKGKPVKKVGKTQQPSVSGKSAAEALSKRQQKLVQVASKKGISKPALLQPLASCTKPLTQLPTIVEDSFGNGIYPNSIGAVTGRFFYVGDYGGVSSMTGLSTRVLVGHLDEDPKMTSFGTTSGAYGWALHSGDMITKIGGQLRTVGPGGVGSLVGSVPATDTLEGLTSNGAELVALMLIPKSGVGNDFVLRRLLPSGPTQLINLSQQAPGEYFFDVEYHQGHYYLSAGSSLWRYTESSGALIQVAEFADGIGIDHLESAGSVMVSLGQQGKIFSLFEIDSSGGICKLSMPLGSYDDSDPTDAATFLPLRTMLVDMDVAPAQNPGGGMVQGSFDIVLADQQSRSPNWPQYEYTPVTPGGRGRILRFRYTP